MYLRLLTTQQKPLQNYMQKLFNILPKIVDKVAQKTQKTLQSLKITLGGYPTSSNTSNLQNVKKGKQSQMILASRIKSKQSIRSYRPIVQTQTQRKADDLVKRKRRLLQQLKTVDDQLKKVNQIKNSKKKKQHTQPEEVLYQRATDLVSKMNKQRKQLTQNRKKQAKNLDKTVQQSISKYKQILESQEKEKQYRRKEIQKRIQQRKNAVLARSKINRQSNSLINELKSYRTSLPQVSNLPLDPQKSQNQASLPKKSAKIKTSPFLQKLKKEQESKKRHDYLKGLQKRRVRSKQVQYSMKFRSRAKYLAESQTFVT